MGWLTLVVAACIVVNASTFYFSPEHCSDWKIVVSLLIGALGWIILFVIDN